VNTHDSASFRKIRHDRHADDQPPDSRNPLGEEGDGELFADAASRINADRDIRCVILTGAGKAFSAGGNLKAMREKSGTFAGPGFSSVSATEATFTAWCARCGASKCR